MNSSRLDNATTTGGDISSSIPTTTAGSENAGDSITSTSNATPLTSARASNDATSVDSTGTSRDSSSTVELTADTLGSARTSVSTVSTPSTTSTVSAVSLPRPPVATDKAGSFNSTIAITLNWTTPMLRLEGNFKINPVTGIGTRQVRNSGASFVNFVGVGYGMNGTISTPGSFGVPSTNDSDLSGQYLSTISGSNYAIRETTLGVDSENLGYMSNLNLSEYHIHWGYDNGIRIELHNLTFQIPVKTQADSLAALLSQAHTEPTIEGGDMSPYFEFQNLPSKTRQELLEMTSETIQQPDYTYLFHGQYSVAEDGLRLRNNTELIYSVPLNTTLVEVLGPVGNNDTYGVFGDCYAYFEPRPSWWLQSNFPTSSSSKPINATDQTLFLLPIDPELSFELRIGTLGRYTHCPVSAIRTYPFHYNFAANLANATTSGTSNSSTGSTPVIVGVVVGVGGGLILLGLVFWLFRRHQKSRKVKEEELLPVPFSESGEPRTKAELERIARGEHLGGGFGTAPLAQGGPATAEGRERHHRVVQEEDGQSIVEYLPPQYRDDWQGRAEQTQRPSSTAQEQPRRLSTGSELMRPQKPSSAPDSLDPALESKVRRLNGPRPWLKQQYARAFGRALPVPPQTSAASGSGAMVEQQQSEKTLHHGLTRGLQAEGPHGGPGAGSADPESRDSVRLNEDGSAAHGSPSQPSEDLKAEYRRWFS